jgi:hypothetical protein
MASVLCVPHKQVAHMAAPTEGQNIKKVLAKGEASTHGVTQTLAAPFGVADPSRIKVFVKCGPVKASGAYRYAVFLSPLTSG